MHRQGRVVTLTVQNDLSCDLSFWWDYTTAVPCGEKIGAGNLNIPGTNIVPKNTIGAFIAYELTFQPCGDQPIVCGCPGLYWEVGSGGSMCNCGYTIECGPAGAITIYTNKFCNGKQILIEYISITSTSFSFRYYTV